MRHISQAISRAAFLRGAAGALGDNARAGMGRLPDAAPRQRMASLLA